MQPNQFSPPLTLREWLLLALATILTASGKAITKWIGGMWRRLRPSAIDEKTKAETRQIDAETVIQTTDAMVELVRQVAEEAVKAGRLRAERDFWQGKAGELKGDLEIVTAERDLLRIQIDTRIRIGDGE